jgi:hypothetical protein
MNAAVHQRGEMCMRACTGVVGDEHVMRCGVCVAAGRVGRLQGPADAHVSWMRGESERACELGRGVCGLGLTATRVCAGGLFLPHGSQPERPH